MFLLDKTDISYILLPVIYWAVIYSSYRISYRYTFSSLGTKEKISLADKLLITLKVIVAGGFILFILADRSRRNMLPHLLKLICMILLPAVIGCIRAYAGSNYREGGTNG